MSLWLITKSTDLRFPGGISRLRSGLPVDQWDQLRVHARRHEFRAIAWKILYMRDRFTSNLKLRGKA